MTAALGNADKQRIAGASQAGVLRHAAQVQGYLSGRQRWLGLNNIYREDPVARLRHEQDNAIPFNSKHLGEYITASALLHCWDGWTFLGRALHAHACGLPDVSRHLAYYAELRGAMSLLATQGIGVFNLQHFVIKSDGQVDALSPNGTHVATWLYLQEWAKSAGSKLIGEVIAPESVRMEMWVRSIPGQPAWTPLGTDWLLRLGLDLRRMADDRAARNFSELSPECPCALGCAFVAGGSTLREGFCPEFGASGSNRLQRARCPFPPAHLRSAFTSLTNSTPRQAPRQYEAAVAGATEIVVPDEDRRNLIADCLRRQHEPLDSIVIEFAERTDAPTHPLHHMQVMSRAAILLRLATGSVAPRMFGAVALEPEMTRWWWAAAGTNHGLSGFGPYVRAVTRYFADIDEGLSDLSDSLDAPNTENSHRCFCRLVRDASGRATPLETLALLGMAS